MVGKYPSMVFDIETVPNVPEGAVEAVTAMAEKRKVDAGLFAATSPMLCRIVAIGMKFGEHEKCIVDGRDVEGEWGLLEAAHQSFAKVDSIVTFNGRAFDIPALLHRSRILGVKPASVLNASAWQKPWETTWHTDMMQLLTFGGATQRYSLEAYALGFGVRNPKTNCHGSDVATMFDERRFNEIAEYCIGDVRATDALFRMFAEVKR